MKTISIAVLNRNLHIAHRVAGLIALVFCGRVAHAQLPPGSNQVSATVYNLSGVIPTPATANTSDGTAASATAVFYDPVDMDYPGTATASAVGGADPGITLMTTGSFGSSVTYTPFEYNVSGTVEYSFEVTGAVTGAPVELIALGAVSASGGLFYPAMFDMTSSSSADPNEDLLMPTLDPSMTGSDADFNLYATGSDDFAAVVDAQINYVYTLTLSASYFTDLGPDNVTVSLDPTLTLAPGYSGDSLLFSPGYGPTPGGSLPDSALPLGMVGVIFAAVLTAARRIRRAAL